MTFEEDLLEEVMEWDAGRFFVEGDLFEPKIYQTTFEEPVPAGFNTVSISLNCGPKSDLDWTKERTLASRYASDGYYLFWELDFGFEEIDVVGLSDHARFQTLSLAVDHFRETVAREFVDRSIGFVVYRGSLDFARKMTWDKLSFERFENWRHESFAQGEGDLGEVFLKRLFARDVLVEYIQCLAARLPDTAPVFVLIDATEIACPWERICLLSSECFEQILPIVKGLPKGVQCMAWEDSTSAVGFYGRTVMELPDSEAPKLGVCLPNSSLLPQANRLKDWVLNCIANAVPFRVHSEALFQMEWDGLDELVIEPAALSDQGERKLLGFQAAGGQVTKL